LNSINKSKIKHIIKLYIHVKYKKSFFEITKKKKKKKKKKYKKKKNKIK